MAKCEKCGQTSTILFNVFGAMLCPICETQTETALSKEIRELIQMTGKQFLAWLEEEKTMNTKRNDDV